MMKLKGIDVSKYQGRIDWDKLKGKVDFVIIKASHGMHDTDDMWERNYTEAKRVGIPIGAYHYFYYGDETKHQQEVDNFLTKLAGKELEYPAFIDFEESAPKFKPPLGGLPRATITSYAVKALERIRQAGFKPGLYANKNWLTNHIEASYIPDDVTVWLAEYNSQPTYQGRYDLWQYSDKGSLDGISSKGLDMNYHYTKDLPHIPDLKRGCPYPEPTETIPYRRNFNGSAARWLQWHLIRAGYDCGVTEAEADTYGTDGFAATKTWDAIDAVVKKAGLGTGDAGPKTRNAVKAAAFM